MRADLLPSSTTCDHPVVDVDEFAPKGASYIEVSVDCRKCPASVNKVHVPK